MCILSIIRCGLASYRDFVGDFKHLGKQEAWDSLIFTLGNPEETAPISVNDGRGHSC